MPHTAATLRLAPHRALLRLGPSARMLGLDPATAVVVDDLTAPMAQLLDALVEATDRAELVDRAALAGADPAQADALLDSLLAAGIVVDAADRRLRERRRAAATVLVRGNGPLTAGLATGLALAGIGAVHVAAGGTVLAGDVGAGYLDADRGHRRGVTAAAAVHRVAPSVRTGPLPQRVQPDLVVLADAVVPAAEQVAELMADRMPHLLVRLRDGVGLVGPHVLPGRSPCLRCLDRHREDRDPDWPHVAALLTGRTGSAEPECVAATAALGTAQALLAVDATSRVPPPALGTTLLLDPATAIVRRQHWSAHPTCPCRAAAPDVTDAPCERSPARETIDS